MTLIYVSVNNLMWILLTYYNFMLYVDRFDLIGIILSNPVASVNGESSLL